MPLCYAVVPPTIALIREVIRCINQLQERSKKDRFLLSESKCLLEKLEAQLEKESEERKEQDEAVRAAAKCESERLERLLQTEVDARRKAGRTMYWIGGVLVALATSPWVYIALHVTGHAR